MYIYYSLIWTHIFLSNQSTASLLDACGHVTSMVKPKDFQIILDGEMENKSFTRLQEDQRERARVHLILRHTISYSVVKSIHLNIQYKRN